jgi:DNA-binding IclR family transcriptional regulator
MDTISGVGVLDKAMIVLSAVADRPMNLAEIQSTTGIPRATTHRLAAALETHAWLRRDAEGRYDLGHGLVALGRESARRFPLADLARPVLEELAATTGESVQLFVREGGRRRCVVSIESPHSLRWIVPEGALLPLGVGSSGRLLDGDPADAASHGDPTGWVESVGEREAGVASVSAPVRSRDGTLLAAVSVSGPIERLSRAPGERFGPAVVAAAERIRVD